MKALIYVPLLFLKVSLLPNASLLIWMAMAMAIDYITGFSKAVVLKQVRTSTGMRRTISKFLQYGGAIAVSVILSQAAEQHKMGDVQHILNLIGDSLVVFIIYIEVTSIFENLIAIDSDSQIAKFFFVPVHRVLTVQIKRNPLTQVAENIDKPNA